ncbi:uncharacterized protein LOC135848125 [Planococcus citri]|uniref:uncharacterized protein LOC135848125 n=1 Tax=Planococcus citri TaxID=170843 RepID=UPI0031F7F9CE
MNKGGKFIDLPKSLKDKKAVINVQNKDEKCFYYCILSKFKAYRPHIAELYHDFEKKLAKRNIKFDFSCINYPTTIKDIQNFEKHNNHVSVNVFIYETKKISPIKVCDMEKKFHYDLLMLKSKGGNYHYTYIKNFSRLVSSQLHKRKTAIEICKRCLVFFAGHNRFEKITEHKKYCNPRSVEPSWFVMPSGNRTHLYYKNYKYETPVTFCAFADFETMLLPVKENTSSKISKLRKYQKHEPIAFSFYVVHSEKGKIRDPVCYVGKNASSIFFDMIKEVGLYVERKYKKYKNVNNCTGFTIEEFEKFHTITKCVICKEDFLPGQKRAREHCHLTGKYIGPSHATPCNINRTTPDFLPVYFHNLSKYDSHLILHGYKRGASDIKVIPTTEETYITFSKKISDNFWIRFVDSYRFLSSSLHKLIESLPTSQLIHTQKYFSEPHLFDLITQKGFFCYDFLNDIKKLQHREIPTKQDFYNELNNQHITDEDYEFVQNVWEKFKCRNLEDYLVIYVISDCLLLADVFLSFRKLCLENYDLDPCYFYSLPGYAFETMLKTTKVKFDLIVDINQYLFLEKALRGGLNNTVCRYSEANNKYVPDHYDPENKKLNTIVYWDVNGLYSHIMRDCKLPVSKFEWIDDSEIQKFTTDFILELDDTSDTGFFLEVDLKYPIELHDFHNAFPFAPEKKTTPNSKISKLLCTLEDKKNYVIHYRNLKLCLKHGLILEKVYKILKFTQENFCKPYIDINTNLRKNAKNAFQKAFFKLLCNSVFGKTIENQRKYMNFRLICNEKKLNTAIKKPSFKSSVIFSENLVGVHSFKSKVILNKPIYVGISILELSRNFMYQFYYENLPEIFKGLPFPQLLYMDTDSFILSVQTDNVYPYIEKTCEQYFDTSNYPINHPCYTNLNNTVPGYFKDELYPDQCKRFISLCPKVYSLDLLNKEDNIKKIKGVKTDIVKKMSFEDFYQCLFENITCRKDQLLFKSINHEIFTIVQQKRALFNYCDKRYFYNNIDSLAYGHYKMLEYINDETSI